MSAVIRALSVAEGIVAICPFPGADGAFDADMAHIRDWKPALVISLTPEAEMVALGRGDLGAKFVEQGARWLHFPIADYGVPDAPATESWRGIERAALAALRGGGRVLIHCRAGQGRSGMIALRLMIAGGERPVAALARLRQVQPEAVETPGQMNWATSKPG
ncbi:protein phosphatase [Roseovarius sp. C7]|uniref:phosphatase domain-containing protein n=1 Tax=Roseovarius sp. C7 TaxID=3398643 RepID=UPI0039F67FA9